MPIAPADLSAALDGLLAFPVTPFDERGRVDVGRFREHVRRQIDNKAKALFVCCGTGEFASLTVEEYAELVAAATAEAGGQLPVCAGVGHGAALATQFARAAGDGGADGILVLPPYLLNGTQEGLYRHCVEVAHATALGVILYQRDNAVFEPETVVRVAEDCPNVVGLKDGHGDVERLQRIQVAAGDRLMLLNGMPTAEVFAPAYVGIGVVTYSSAVFSFVPEIATAFYTALHAQDRTATTRLFREFYSPFAKLRNTTPGYAIALIKAGLALRGFPVGGVRSPLVDPGSEHLAQLDAVIRRGLASLDGHAGR